MSKLFIYFFSSSLFHLHGNVAIIKCLYMSLSNDRELRSLTNTKTYKSFWIFFEYSSELPPLKYKNKIRIKQVKALQFFFFFFFCSILFFFFLLLFCFVIVWSDIEVQEKEINQRLIWAYSISMLLPIFPGRSRYFSLNFWASLDPEVTVHQISAELCPLKIFCFQLILLTVYIWSTQLYRSQSMCYIL